MLNSLPHIGVLSTGLDFILKFYLVGEGRKGEGRSQVGIVEEEGDGEEEEGTNKKKRIRKRSKERKRKEEEV